MNTVNAISGDFCYWCKQKGYAAAHENRRERNPKVTEIHEEERVANVRRDISHAEEVLQSAPSHSSWTKIEQGEHPVKGRWADVADSESGSAGRKTSVEHPRTPPIERMQNKYSSSRIIGKKNERG